MANVTDLSRKVTRRRAIRYLGSTTLFFPLLNRLNAASTAARGRGLDAIDLVRQSRAVDMLGFPTADWRKLDRWCTVPDSFTDDDFEKINRSGLGVFHPAVRFPTSDPRGSAERWLDKWRRFVSFHPIRFRIIESTRDLGPDLGAPIGVLLGMQDSEHFRRIEDVAYFAALGQRVSQLTYNGPSRFGSGCRTPRDRGLTAAGAELVSALNRHGVAIDLSHCGANTTLDAIAASQRPTLVTHSNCAALNPRQPRCKSDAEIQALAANGGVFGVSMIRNFVASSSSSATLDGYLDHIDHVATLVGPQFVGIGSDSDLDGLQPVLTDVDSVEFLYSIAAGLLQRGYGEAETLGVLGGNFRRVLAAILPPAA